MKRTSQIQVLIVGDHYETATLWAHALSQRTILTSAVSLDSFYAQDLGNDSCELLVLDINGDKARVRNICHSFRSAFDGPILFFTYEQDERFHLELYEAGIDESIVKPIGIPLFLAKVMSWLRKTPSLSLYQRSTPSTCFQFDHVQRVLTTPEGKTAKLSKLESNLIICLSSNEGQVLEPEMIINGIWPTSTDADSLLLKNLVYRLRQKIEQDPRQPQYLCTVVGRGYRFHGELCTAQS